MCRRCALLAIPREFLTPSEYRELARRLREGRDLRLVRGTCPLEALDSAGPWPADILEHEFACAECGARFRLWADTYHGRASWSAAAR